MLFPTILVGKKKSGLPRCARNNVLASVLLLAFVDVHINVGLFEGFFEGVGFAPGTYTVADAGIKWNGTVGIIGIYECIKMPDSFFYFFVGVAAKTYYGKFITTFKQIPALCLQ